MNKLGIKIIITVLMVAIFLAPISAGIKINDKGNLAVNIEKNEAKAVTITELFSSSKIENLKANSNSVSFTASIILNKDFSVSDTNKGSAGAWKGKDGEGEWRRTKGSSGNISGQWTAGKPDGTGTWKAINTDKTSGTWSTETDSGTWTTKSGTGGEGTAVWTASSFLDYYDNIGGTSGDPRTGIYFKIKGNGLEKENYYLTDFTTSTGSPISFDTTKTDNIFNLKTASILKPDTDYTIQLVIKGDVAWYVLGSYDPFESEIKSFRTTPINSNDSNDKYASGESTSNGNGQGYNLGCTIFNGVDGIVGCIAGVFYMIWEVSAVIAKFAGNLLDFFVYYSTNSSSYTNEFVSQAWGAVRDIANIFFIIALLYVAIKTILGLNVTDNKKLVGAVIIIGLIINFSLFTTKLVIDGSNILAKVFYNNIVSTKEGSTDTASGASGQKSISVGLISKYNPQEVITTEQQYIQNRGTFIFVTIFLIVITLFTAYIFFSVALLFVARVVSLWLSMIFSPIAFASYTVPFDIPGFGHKEWWKGLFENAILAPLFIFFLYIIVLFAGFLKTITDKTDSLLTVAIPFIILAVLLMKAKEMAVKYAGDMGKVIQGAGAAIGGLAIGGAALSLAAAGRGTVGAFMKASSTGDIAANRMQGADVRIATHRATLANPNSTIVERMHARKEIRREKRDQIKGSIQEALGLNELHTLVGRRLNQDQQNIEHAAHARHDLDTAANVVAPGKKWEELNGGQRILARTNMERDRVVRENAGDATAGPPTIAGLTSRLGNRKWAELSPVEQAAITAAIRPRIEGGTTYADQHTIQEARVKQGFVSNVVQSTVTGSYDVRNLSKVIAKEQNTGFSKIAAGLTGALAMGLRGGLKSALNVNYGEGQKNLIKDLGHTITEALKGAKLNVDLSHVGEQKKEEHKGGGHSKSGSGGHGGGAPAGGSHH